MFYIHNYVEILARTSNKVKPTNENETSNHTSLASVRNAYRTRATKPLRAAVREIKQSRPLAKKQPLYIQNIQNANVQSSDMHKTSMFKITDPHEYSKNPVNHIPLLLRKQLKGILHRNTQQYGKYHLRRTWL